MLHVNEVWHFLILMEDGCGLEPPNPSNCASKPFVFRLQPHWFRLENFLVRKNTRHPSGLALNRLIISVEHPDGLFLTRHALVRFYVVVVSSKSTRGKGKVDVSQWHIHVNFVNLMDILFCIVIWR